MTKDTLAVDQLLSAALIDSLAAELIGTGVVQGDRLADRIEGVAEHHASVRQAMLKALARGLRGQQEPTLRLIRGGLAASDADAPIAD